jgi:NitT/TauT family transport system ATP-binding protein
MPVLSIRDVSFEYSSAGNKPLAVLKHLNLTVERGEIVSVIGPSGSGKSTMLRLCAGVLEPTRGEIVYWNEKKSIEDRPWIPLVEQTPALLPWRNVIDNIALYGEILGRPRARAQAQLYCQRVGLTNFESYLPGELSGGMQTRVSIARALSVAEELILLDEPFSNLDELTRFRILEDLSREVRSKSITAIIVSHNIEEAIYICDRIAIMGNRPATLCDIIRPSIKTLDVQSALASAEFIEAVGRIRSLARTLWG